MESFLSKSMEFTYRFGNGLCFLYTLKRIGYKIVHLSLSIITTGIAMLICHLQLEMKSKTECPFLMYRLFVKIQHLPFLSTVNLHLVEFIHILTAFYHLPLNLVLFTQSLIGASKYAQVNISH